MDVPMQMGTVCFRMADSNACHWGYKLQAISAVWGLASCRHVRRRARRDIVARAHPPPPPTPPLLQELSYMLAGSPTFYMSMLLGGVLHLPAQCTPSLHWWLAGCWLTGFGTLWATGAATCHGLQDGVDIRDASMPALWHVPHTLLIISATGPLTHCFFSLCGCTPSSPICSTLAHFLPHQVLWLALWVPHNYVHIHGGIYMWVGCAGAVGATGPLTHCFLVYVGALQVAPYDPHLLISCHTRCSG